METQRLHYYAYSVGNYEQESNTVFVSDPAYEYEVEEHTNKCIVKLNLIINNIKSGVWNIILRIRSDLEDKNAELLTVHNHFIINSLDTRWEKIGTVCIDSGKAGIYDVMYYRDSSAIVLNSNSSIAIVSHGVVAKSGFGCGTYPVYIIKNNLSQIIGIKIIFFN